MNDYVENKKKRLRSFERLSPEELVNWRKTKWLDLRVFSGNRGWCAETTNISYALVIELIPEYSNGGYDKENAIVSNLVGELMERKFCHNCRHRLIRELKREPGCAHLQLERRDQWRVEIKGLYP